MLAILEFSSKMSMTSLIKAGNMMIQASSGSRLEAQEIGVPDRSGSVGETVPISMERVILKISEKILR